ncbi:MAG: hypothetical protein JXD23_07480 [Spirochaetales bacterium]|nr:hypothetical protein [Spirochaetales bacterium]
MIRKIEILRILHERGVPAVVIGGVALRIHGSPRVTHDLDVAIRSEDVAAVIDLMYASGYYCARASTPTALRMLLTPSAAKEWVEASKSGSMTFVHFDAPLAAADMPFSRIDINTEIDFIFALSIPVPRLRENAKEIMFENFPVFVASPADLLALKKKRPDKSPADEADIAFLQRLIAEKP